MDNATPISHFVIDAKGKCQCYVQNTSLRLLDQRLPKQYSLLLFCSPELNTKAVSMKTLPIFF